VKITDKKNDETNPIFFYDFNGPPKKQSQFAGCFSVFGTRPQP